MARWTKAERETLRRLYEQSIVGREAAAEMGRSIDSVDKKARSLGLTVPPQAAPAAAPIEERAREEALRGAVRQSKADLKLALLKIDELQNVRDLVAAACGAIKPQGNVFKPPRQWRNKGKHQAVALVGDWQIGEVISPSETEEYGSFDFAIAKARVETYAKEVIKWIETQRSGLVVESLCVPVLGDMVSGDIHEELQRHNEWPMPVAAVRCGELLADFVASLAPHAKTVTVEMVGLDNHGRLTKKLQWKMGAFNSWNYVVFAVAQARLARHSNVTMTYLDAGVSKRAWPGAGVLLLHGHQMRGWMGVPYYSIQRYRGRKAEQELEAMLKALGKMEPYRPFREMIMGHQHVPARLRGCIVNGCLTGTTELDHNLGRHAPPSQTSFLWHERFGPFNYTEWKLDGR